MHKPVTLALILLAAQPAFAQTASAASDGPVQLAPPAPGIPQVTPQAAPTSAAPEVVPAAQAPPPWFESKEIRGGGPACLIGKQSGGYAFELAVSSAIPGSVVFSIRRPGWGLTAADGLPTTMAFVDGATMTEAASMSADGLSVSFDANSFHPWLHEFTKAPKVLITPPNNAFQPFYITLNGTTSAINQMGDCIKTSGIQGVPPPFVSASAAPVTAAQPPAANNTPQAQPSQPLLTVNDIIAEGTDVSGKAVRVRGLAMCFGDLKKCHVFQPGTTNGIFFGADILDIPTRKKLLDCGSLPWGCAATIEGLGTVVTVTNQMGQTEDQPGVEALRVEF